MCTLSECCYCSNAVDLEINIYMVNMVNFPLFLTSTLEATHS